MIDRVMRLLASSEREVIFCHSHLRKNSNMPIDTLKIHIPAKAPASRIRRRQNVGHRSSTIPFPMSDELLVERLTFRNGQVCASHFVAESNQQRFWRSDRSGVVVYVDTDGPLKVSGGLLAGDEDKPQLLDEFLTFIRKRNRSAVFFNIADNDLPLFQERGFHTIPWEDEAVLDLANWDSQESNFEWLRSQRDNCQRAGIRCLEWQPDLSSEDADRDICDQIQRIAADSLTSNTQLAESARFKGHVDFLRLGRRRVFLARSEDGAGQIEAVLIACPYSSGTCWGLEIYGCRQDAIRGVVPHLQLAAIDTLRAEGIDQVSLGQIQSLYRPRKTQVNPCLSQRLLNLGADCMNWLFKPANLPSDITGFRPRLESRYVCAYPRPSLLAGLMAKRFIESCKSSATILLRRLTCW